VTGRAGVAIVGCGYVADYYMKTLPAYADLELIGVTDRDRERLELFSTHHRVARFHDLDELLADPRVAIVLNLTNPLSHYEVTRASLLVGKHVYSEKPLATEMSLARELVDLAEERGLQLSSAPCSLLGETAQTMWRVVRDGKVGTIRAVYAEMDEGLVHRMPFRRWASGAGAPWPYRDEFERGTVLEHAGYVVTWLPAMFGPAVSVTGFADCLIPRKGEVDTTGTDFAVAVIRFASGVVARLTCTLIAPHDHSLTVIGDRGVLSTDDTWFYGSPVSFRRSVNIGPRHQWLPRRRIRLSGKPVKYGYRGTQQMDFARGVADLASAVRDGRSPRLSARYCLHTNEIVLAVSDALRTSSSYEMTTGFDPIEPMPWAE
jgi:predicted dehydrogenase